MILLDVKSVFSLLLLFILTVIVYEGAHYIAALMLGILIAHFTWFDPSYFFPVLVPALKNYTTGMKIVSYAGGLVIGVLLLAILLLKKAWFKQTLHRWPLGFYVAMFGFWETCQGILEEAFHRAYISNVTNLLLSLAHRLRLCGFGYVSILVTYASAKRIKSVRSLVIATLC